jgi:hypothetical protein
LRGSHVNHWDTASTYTFVFIFNVTEEESRAFVQVPMSPTSEKFVSDDNGQMALEGSIFFYELVDQF